MAKKYTQVGNSSRSTLPVKSVSAKTGKAQPTKTFDLNLTNESYDFKEKIIKDSPHGRKAVKETANKYKARSTIGKKLNVAGRAAAKVTKRKKK